MPGARSYGRRGAELPDDAKLAPGTVRRVWGFARAYRFLILAFLAIIGISALLGAATPLLVRELIDTAIPNRDGMINLISLAAVGLALLGAALTIAQRWFSARIGEGLIYDLRTALFDHVQRHAARVLHPHPDRRPHQPDEQRRGRGPAGAHGHPRLGHLRHRRAWSPPWP